MKRTLIALGLALMLITAGCAGTPSSNEDRSQEIAQNETFTFTKPAPDVDNKQWACITWDKYGGGDDNQMECELVNESTY